MNNPAILFTQQPYFIDIPFEGTTSSSFGFSYYGNGSTAQRMKGIDGYILNYSLANGLDFTVSGTSGLAINYSIPQTGKCRVYFKEGMSRVYSIKIVKTTGASGNRTNVFKIENIEHFFKPFSNLYSLDINVYASGDNALKPTFSGNISKLPKTIERIRFSTSDFKDGLFMNLDDFTSEHRLKWFYWLGSYSVSGSNLNLFGNLKFLPPLLSYFDVRKVLSTAIITYSGGKEFPSSFEKFYLNHNLATSDLDLLLNDMAANITTAIGEKIIYLRGTRTSASDSAVAYLQSLGFTVTITA